jgi:hypothetical protein
MQDDDPLYRHDLRKLEQAAKMLQDHIRARKRRPISPIRKRIGLVVALALIIGGALLIFPRFDLARPDFTVGPFCAIGLTFIAVGIFWIAEDWFGFG